MAERDRSSGLCVMSIGAQTEPHVLRVVCALWCCRILQVHAAAAEASWQG